MITVYEVITKIDDFGNVYYCVRKLLVSEKPSNEFRRNKHWDVYTEYFTSKEDAMKSIEEKTK